MSFRGGDGLFVLELPQHDVAIVARVGVLERQQFVERDAERVDVGPGVDHARLAGRLLGAHVAERADDVAGERDAAVVLHPREAEVGDPELALQIEQQVRRLHVAVDDAVVVRVLQRFGRLFAEPGHAAEELAAADRAGPTRAPRRD